jgi:hypothetical protein
MKRFDPETLQRLHETKEVAIRTTAHPAHPVVIWIAVAGDEVFVRSARGTKGRWYRDLMAQPSATVDVAGHSVAVRAVAANDSSSNERASREYLRKYRDSPYAQSVVRSELLSTTLRLEPA